MQNDISAAQSGGRRTDFERDADLLCQRCSIFGVSGAVVGAAVVGGVMQNRAAKKAGQQQAQSAAASDAIASQTADKQIAMQREQFDRQEALQREQMARDRQIYDTTREDGRLGREVGQGALRQYWTDAVDKGFQYDPRAFDTDRIMNDPGVQFRQQTQENALRRQLNAGNGVYSGAAAKELLKFSSGLASQEYGAAYGRAADGEARRKDQYQLRTNQLATLANIGQVANSSSQVAGQAFGQAGQNAVGAMGQAGQNLATGSGNALGQYGLNASSNAIGLGNARAGNSMYQANTWQNAVNQGASAWGRAGYGFTPAGNFGGAGYRAGAGSSGNTGWADQSYE